MQAMGVCVHCGGSGETNIERLLFSSAGRELDLELCPDCRRTLLTEDDITTRLVH